MLYIICMTYPGSSARPWTSSSLRASRRRPEVRAEIRSPSRNSDTHTMSGRGVSPLRLKASIAPVT